MTTFADACAQAKEHAAKAGKFTVVIYTVRCTRQGVPFVAENEYQWGFSAHDSGRTICREYTPKGEFTDLIQRFVRGES